MDIKRQDSGTWMLNGEATIHNIDALYQGLKEVANSDPPYVLNLSGIESLDTAGAQVLIAFRRSQRESRVIYSGLAEPLYSKLTSFGLAREIGANDPNGDDDPGMES